MCLIDVPNLKEIKPQEGYLLCGSKILQKRCEEEEEGEDKCEENWAIFGSVYLVHH